MRNLILAISIILCTSFSLQAQKYLDIEGDGSLTGNLGVGVNTPLERLHLNGGILLGNTVNTNNGTIRFTGSDFEGRIGGTWISLTGGGGASPWTESNSNIFFNGGNVYIGNTGSPSFLQVDGTAQFGDQYRTFYTPPWTPSNSKVIAGVFDGKDTDAPVVRYLAPGGEYTDVGVNVDGDFLVQTQDIERFRVDYATGDATLGLTNDLSTLFVNGYMQVTRPNFNSFYVPGWAATPRKQVFAGVFDGQGTYAPLLRFAGPNAEYTDIGVDTMGNFEIQTIGTPRLTVDYTTGKVGIGTSNPTEQLNVVTTSSEIAIHGEGGYMGVFGEALDNDNSNKYGVYGIIPGGTGTGDNYGLYGSANAGGGTAYGVFGSASPMSGRAYGVYAQGDLKATNRLFVNTTEAEEDNDTDREMVVTGEAIITGNSDGRIPLQGIYTGSSSDIPGVYGVNDANDYYGYGVYGKGGYIGVYGQVNPTGDDSYRGVMGIVDGGTGENAGVYGAASGSGRNYAFYGSGDLKVTSQVFIGTNTTQEDAASDYELVVDGEAIVEELVVELSANWPDYVFKEDYDLKSLSEVKTFIDENGHLPEIPSAAEMEASDGVAVGEMQRILLQKVEELTLYMIELEEKNKALEAQIKALQNK